MMTDSEVRKQSEAAFGQWRDQWDEHAKINGELLKKTGTSQKDILREGIGKQLIIGAVGYSLVEQIETLREAQKNSDIMAIDKSFGMMIDNGVMPKYVVLADANINYEKWCEPWIEQTKDIILIANVCSAVSWTLNWKGKVIFYVNKDNIQTEVRYSQLSGCYEIIPASASVGNTAVVFATQILGYDRYLLIGYDYGWRADTKYYAFEDDDKRYWMKHIHMIDIKGNLVYSSGNLDFAARWLTDFLQKFSFIPVFNCSDAGVIVARNSNFAQRVKEWKPRTPTQKEIEERENSRLEEKTIEIGSLNDLAGLGEYAIKNITIRYRKAA